MYKKIFVALDGSDSARCALDEAIRIAKSTHGTITAVCVVEHRPQLVDVGAGFVEQPERNHEMSDAATAALGEAKAALDKNQVDGSVRAIDVYGEDIAAVLARTAAENGAELIVMGTRGRHGLKRLLLGSVAESLLRIADRPVLMLRQPEPEEQKAVG